MVDKVNILGELQELVDRQFNKILKIEVNKQPFDIAIRSSEIPQIHSLHWNHQNLVIWFKDSVTELPEPVDQNDEFEFVINSKGMIDGAVFFEPQKLMRKKNHFHINKTIFGEIEKNKSEIHSNREMIDMQIRTRTAHAVSDIFEYVSAHVQNKTGNLELQRST